MEDHQTNQATKNATDRKKTWQAPHLVNLSVNKTNGGDFENDTEGSWWIFTWGPQS